jgi:hypothetical protein
MAIERKRLSAEVSDLLRHLELRGGQVSFPRETFLTWRRRMRVIPEARRFQLKVELLAAARRMGRYSLSGAAEAIAQLVALVNDRARPAAKRSWSASAQP